MAGRAQYRLSLAVFMALVMFSSLFTLLGTPEDFSGRLGTRAELPVPSGVEGRAVSAADRDATVRASSVRSLVTSIDFGGNDEDFATACVTDENGTVYACGYSWESGLPVTGDAYQATSNGRYDGWYGQWSVDGTLVYMTYFGGSLNDLAWDLSLHGGYVHLVGYTESDDYPTTVNAYQAARSQNFDVFFTVFDVATGALNYSTYLGGTGSDRAYGVDVDQYGVAWGVGSNEIDVADDFPTTGSAMNGTYGGGVKDIIVFAMDRFGNLPYSTFVAAGDVEEARAVVVVDDSGGAGDVRVGVSGITESSDFPNTTGAYDRYKAPGANWFFLQHETVGYVGQRLVYSTYLGGGLVGEEYEYPGLDYSAERDQFVLAGSVEGNVFPDTAGAPQASNGGGHDGYVAWFVGTGGAGGADLQCATYLGGSGDEHLFEARFDSRGNVIVAGSSRSTNLPTAGLRAVPRAEGAGRDVLFARYSPPVAFGTTLNFSSCYSEGNWDEVWGLSVDPLSDDPRMVGVSTPSSATGGSGRYESQYMTLLDVVLPTEPHFNATYVFDDVDEKGEELRMVCNTTRSTDLDGSQIDGVYLWLTDDSGDTEEYEAEREKSYSTFYEVSVVINSTGNYTYEFVAVTRDNGQGSVVGSFKIPGPNVTAALLAAEDRLPVAQAILDLFGEYGMYILTVVATFPVLLFGWYRGDYEDDVYGPLTAMSIAIFMVVVRVANVPGAWEYWQVGVVWGVVAVWGQIVGNPEYEKQYQTLTLGLAAVLGMLAGYSYVASGYACSWWPLAALAAGAVVVVLIIQLNTLRKARAGERTAKSSG